jgi:hypothetical protein
VSHSRLSNPVRLLAKLLACAVVLVFAAPAHAQEEPTLVKARVVAELNQDGNNSVEATYTVEGTDGLEGGAVEHLMVRQPGAEVGEISAGEGGSREVEFSEGEGISRVQIPVSGDPATYTLRYEVRTDPQTYTVPIAVPDVIVAQPGDSDIVIETLLPDGERLTGEVFPSVTSMETRDGRQVLVNRVNNVPSRVVAQYGEGGGLTISDFTSAAALGVFGVVLVFWYRRTFGGRSR